MEGEPKKIYLVTTGCYSDYSVQGVYSTRERAEAALVAVAADGYSEPDIEEYWLDDPVTEMPYWRVNIDARGAKATRVPVTGAVGRDQHSWRGFHAPWFVAYIFAPDEAHAIKIASERHAAWLATKGVTR